MAPERALPETIGRKRMRLASLSTLSRAAAPSGGSGPEFPTAQSGLWSYQFKTSAKRSSSDGSKPTLSLTNRHLSSQERISATAAMGIIGLNGIPKRPFWPRPHQEYGLTSQHGECQPFFALQPRRRRRAGPGSRCKITLILFSRPCYPPLTIPEKHPSGSAPPTIACPAHYARTSMRRQPPPACGPVEEAAFGSGDTGYR